jgi:hypothetical protein
MPQVACSLNFINFGYCMVELCIYIVCMVGPCVNFHKLSVDPVKVKFGECYSVSKNPKKYEIYCLIHFNRVSQLCQNQPFCLFFLVRGVPGVVRPSPRACLLGVCPRGYHRDDCIALYP